MTDFTPFDDMKDSPTSTWNIEWGNGMERETTLTFIAFYARNFDDDATVEAVAEGMEDLSDSELSVQDSQSEGVDDL